MRLTVFQAKTLRNELDKAIKTLDKTKSVKELKKVYDTSNHFIFCNFADFVKLTTKNTPYFVGKIDGIKIAMDIMHLDKGTEEDDQWV